MFYDNQVVYRMLGRFYGQNCFRVDGAKIPHHVMSAEPPALASVAVSGVSLASDGLAAPVHDVHHTVRPVLGAPPRGLARLAEAAALVAVLLSARPRLDVRHVGPPVGRAVLRTLSGGAETADLVTTHDTRAIPRVRGRATPQKPERRRAVAGQKGATVENIVAKNAAYLICVVGQATLGRRYRCLWDGTSSTRYFLFWCDIRLR